MEQLMTEYITVHGGLTSAPELRFSQAGVAIVSGTVASTERYKNRDNEWVDGKSLYLRYSAFKDLAENIGASNLDKGSQVVVTGKLHTREYDDREGNKRSSTELEVTDFAVSLRRAVAEVTKSGPAVPARQNQADTAAADAWSTPDTFGAETPF
jgi:single-strand DNA-binding protein